MDNRSKVINRDKSNKETLAQTVKGIQEPLWLSRSILRCISEKSGVPAKQTYRILEAAREVAQELGAADEIIAKYGADKSALIQILLDIQRENQWLPKSVLMYVSERLGIPLSQIYHVATFGKVFNFTPQGRHYIYVCLGTACHVRGVPQLLERVMNILNIRLGGTSPDRKFTLSTVNCAGCCALGPMLIIDGRYYPDPSAKEIEQIAVAYK